jgi:hypothetical protein
MPTSTKPTAGTIRSRPLVRERHTRTSMKIAPLRVTPRLQPPSKGSRCAAWSLWAALPWQHGIRTTLIGVGAAEASAAAGVSHHLPRRLGSPHRGHNSRPTEPKRRGWPPCSNKQSNPRITYGETQVTSRYRVSRVDSQASDRAGCSTGTIS